MSQAPFDPCRQWLGIDAVDLADPRLVLGVSPAEFDRLAVIRAAERRLAMLRGVPAGQADRARDALVKRVEEARDSVLAQIGTQPAARLSMPPPPGNSAARPPLPTARPAPVPVVPSVPKPPAPAAIMPDDAGDDHADASGIRIRPAVTYRRRSSGTGVLVLLIAALAATAAGLYWFKFRSVGKASKPVPRDVAATEQAPPTPTPPSTTPSPPERPKRRPERRPAAEERPLASAQAASPEPTASDPPEPPPARPTPGPGRQPMRESEGPAPAGTTTEESPRLEEELRKVATALRAADFDSATTSADAAAAAAATPAGRTRAECWAELVTFARGFAGYRDQALAAVQPGNEYDVDGKKIGVVELDDKRFVYRFAGRNRTAPRDRIPGGIVMAIVETWFDDKPANDLFIGAYQATKEKPDLDKARAAWERAQARGADASLLLPLLDDPLLSPDR